MIRSTATKSPSKSQIQKFRETARKIETDDSEERFDHFLGKVARHKSEARPVVHASDCAAHDAPAYEAGPCTCGAIKAER